jgi:phage recombination protein Bet
MSNDLPAQIDAAAWESKIDLIRRTVAAGATADELELFFHQARKAGLDPLAREIYFVKRQGKGTIQVGIDGLRKIAHRTGACAGIEDATFTEPNERGYPASARVVVYRMVEGQRCPFSATARWDEYFPGDAQGFQWKRMPHTMLGKCAEGLALRKGFPQEMSGLHTHEEMDQADKGEEPPQAGNPAPVRPTSPDLGGAALIEAAKEASGQSPANGDGKEAFGYVPMRWPVAKMFADPGTESQSKMLRAKFRERMLDLDDLPAIKRLVLEAYGLEDEESKAHYSLVVDWAMNADDEALDRATNAAEEEAKTAVAGELG